MQNDFPGSYLRHRNQGYLTVYFACHTGFLGADLKITKKKSSWSCRVACEMAHFKQQVHLSAVWAVVLFLCLAGISRLIPRRIREHRWMLNKIQVKRCAPVSLCSGECLGKLLLADPEKSGLVWEILLPAAFFLHLLSLMLPLDTVSTPLSAHLTDSCPCAQTHPHVRMVNVGGVPAFHFYLHRDLNRKMKKKSSRKPW